ncbi:dTDP-4-dehydrorhamnose 3,5-epimerase [Reyranella sp.]|uniref:dTDP-4-dehydrorhamnose 3,5-epimerase n=1 Tax=Reyranella sp. TaxID=1929291 RepID=UPI003BAC500D
MNFQACDVGFGGLKLIEARRFDDDRGYFVETWSAASFEALGVGTAFVQDNQSLSRRKGTLRGLHFQSEPFAQAKLVRVLAGAIYDVVVDLRESSPTYGRWFAMELSAADNTQLFIPRGLAHGFFTLADDTLVAYKADAPYAPRHDRGIRWDDPDLAIEWPIRDQVLTISDKDRSLPGFRELAAVEAR